MEESHFLGLPHPLNLYGICKVWHTGVLKALVASENKLLSAMTLEDAGNVSWIFEQSPILTLPEKSQIVSVATANPLMIGASNGTEGSPKMSRRCLIGVTYCIPPPSQETPAPEPEPSPAPARPPPTRPSGVSSSFVSRILQGTRPPAPQTPQKPVDVPQPLLQPRFFFSILGANSYEIDHWSTIVEDNVTFELPYAPFVLAKYAPPNSSNVLFMVSGADRRIHVFNQHAADTSNTEVSNGESVDPTSTSPARLRFPISRPLALPLLESYPSPVVSLDVLDAIDGQLHVIVGCQDGSIILTTGDGSGSGSVNRQISTILDGPITSVKIYQVARNRAKGSGMLIPTENDQTTSASSHPSVRRVMKHVNRASLSSPSSPALLSSSNFSSATPPPGNGQGTSGIGNTLASPSLNASGAEIPEKVTQNEFAINVVVASAVGFAAVFRNVVENDFDDFHLLPDSDKHDAVLGLAVSDIDHDGHVEILVGTYGQKILAYAETKGKPPPSRRSAKKPLSPLNFSQSSDLTSSTSRLQQSTSGSNINISRTRLQSNDASPLIRPRRGSRAGMDSAGVESGARLSQAVSSSVSSEAASSEPSSSIQPSRADSNSSEGLGTTPTESNPVFTTEAPSALASVGNKFAKFFDQKQEDYIRENVVTSVIPTSTLAQQIQEGSSTSAAPGEKKDVPNRVLFDFRSSPQTAAPIPSANDDMSILVLDSSVRETDLVSEEVFSGYEQNGTFNTFSLLWHRTFTHPIYQIICDDFIQDGSVSVIASSLYGIHLLRTDFDLAVVKAQRRLQLLSDIMKLERQIYRQERNRSKGGSSPSRVLPTSGTPEKVQ